MHGTSDDTKLIMSKRAVMIHTRSKASPIYTETPTKDAMHAKKNPRNLLPSKLNPPPCRVHYQLFLRSRASCPFSFLRAFLPS